MPVLAMLELAMLELDMPVLATLELAMLELEIEELIPPPIPAAVELMLDELGPLLPPTPTVELELAKQFGGQPAPPAPMVELVIDVLLQMPVKHEPPALVTVVLTVDVLQVLVDMHPPAPPRLTTLLVLLIPPKPLVTLVVPFVMHEVMHPPAPPIMPVPTVARRLLVDESVALDAPPIPLPFEEVAGPTVPPPMLVDEVLCEEVLDIEDETLDIQPWQGPQVKSFWQTWIPVVPSVHSHDVC